MSKELSDEELQALIGAEEEKPDTSVVVEGASGAEFTVWNDDESEWFTNNLGRYLSEYEFGNVSDLQDLDRLLGLELLSYRYSSWMLKGVDYDGSIFDEKAVRDHKGKIDQEIRLVKASMGMDRKGRVSDEQQSTADFIRSLLQRAREFGVHRDEQIAKALDLMSEVQKLVGLHDRSDEEERHQLQVEAEHIVDWLRTTAIPEYQAIDAAFRKNQKLWIRELSRVRQ
jgi:hypothetical protein